MKGHMLYNIHSIFRLLHIRLNIRQVDRQRTIQNISTEVVLAFRGSISGELAGSLRAENS